MKQYAEEAKIQCSFNESYNLLADLGDIPGHDDDGEEFELDIQVDQAMMKDAIGPVFQQAIDLCKELLRRNGDLKGSDLTTLLLVGGPTYSPILRGMLKEQLTEKIDSSVDLMTVVAQGAALYASTIDVSAEVREESRDRTKVQLHLSYEATTVETDELVNVGDPPALPGRPSVFDVSGSNVRNSPREPLKHHAGESSMNNYRSLNHTKWECQYHVVFIPKYRRKTLYGGLRHYLGDVLRRLAEQRESRVEEGHLLADHVHMLVSIPPKYSVAQVIGYIKGKSAIHIAREFAGRPRNFVGQHFWARGYYVSTVGQDERVVREYIQQQEREDRRLEQLRLEE